MYIIDDAGLEKDFEPHTGDQVAMVIGDTRETLEEIGKFGDIGDFEGCRIAVVTLRILLSCSLADL